MNSQARKSFGSGTSCTQGEHYFLDPPIRLGSLITGAVGIALMVFLRGVAHEEPVYLVGLIPLVIGVALFVYAQFLVPKL
jgi:hypothetical protein